MSQWPDNICSGRIRYDAAGNYKEFCLRDEEHGIPTFGAVSVNVFNYPGQAEDIAKRLVACWNAFEGYTLEQIESAADRLLR